MLIDHTEANNTIWYHGLTCKLLHLVSLIMKSHDFFDHETCLKSQFNCTGDGQNGTRQLIKQHLIKTTFDQKNNI